MRARAIGGRSSRFPSSQGRTSGMQTNLTNNLDTSNCPPLGGCESKEGKRVPQDSKWRNRRLRDSTPRSSDGTAPTSNATPSEAASEVRQIFATHACHGEVY